MEDTPVTGRPADAEQSQSASVIRMRRKRAERKIVTALQRGYLADGIGAQAIARATA